ncbi:MAG: restriction endonuclease, partial [Mycobacteriales bacterium]
VHDLKLRGESTVAHQIDATVGDGEARKRILIECKDYSEAVGLAAVRSFWAVVDDLKPDAAYIVTTDRFTEPAATFAAAKGITAAVLRPPREEDWQGIVRRIELTISMLVPLGDPEMKWLADPSTSEEEIAAAPQGTAPTRSLFLVDEWGERRPAKPEIEKALSPPLDFEGEYEGTHRFAEPTWLQVGEFAPLKVVGFQFRQSWGHATQEVVVGEGIAGLTAELALRSLDGSIHRMFSNHDLQQWTFDADGKVVPRQERRAA